jgi:ubiquinone/menaquinone biosynthesis C-methylase UbiE
VSEAMLFWMVPIIFIIIVLGALSLIRLGVSRDTTKEGANDRDSVWAYDSVSRSPLFGVIRYRVLRKLKKYRPEGTLLDAGCGPGYLDRAIALEYPKLKIIGLDVSKEMLDLATSQASSTKINPRISYQEGDIQKIPFKNNSMDFVVSTLSMHHLARPEEALGEIFRVLKPKGQLFIFDLRRDMPETLFYLIRFVQRFFAPNPIRLTNGGEGSVLSSFTPLEMKTLLSQSPFPVWTIQKGWGWYYVWSRKE